ncbi:MAG: purine-binding chemotaxis protein CheW [Bacteroidales bacterium]|nr:purine-binding chemotaxis protein CheW [Bacteroidales bacterium]
MQEIKPVTQSDKLVMFSLDEFYFAIAVGVVERIIPSVIITPVPGTPENVLGVINIRGQAIPVFNIRRIFGLASRTVQISDKIIIARNSERVIALIVDDVTVLSDQLNQKKVMAGEFLQANETIVDGLSFFEDGMILIYNIDRIISQKEGVILDLALKRKKSKDASN